MTNEQIKQIEKFRADGCGYARIAELLSLSKNTVKSYCQRHGLSGVAAKEEAAIEQSFCKECGATLEQTPGRKEAKFCSDTCRNAWWNAHQNMVRRKAVYEFTCAGCGRRFAPSPRSLQNTPPEHSAKRSRPFGFSPLMPYDQEAKTTVPWTVVFDWYTIRGSNPGHPD